MRERFDVVVVGLGPAGACAAAEAARRGCRVLGLERKKIPGRPVQCAEFVPALLGMEASALGHAVRQPIRAMRTYLEGAGPDIEERFPGHMLDRARFDAMLADEAARAGAQCRFGVAARAITRDGRVELADGSAIKAPVIVGADGPRSAVGRRIGRRNTQLIETRQVTVPLLAAHEATDIFLSAGIPGGYGWLFPKRELAHVGAGVAPAHRGRLKEIVSGLHDALAREGRVGRRVLARTGGAIPAGGLLEPRGLLGEALVLLAGDAAGLANPVTGAGIAAAVISGRLAGEAAAARCASAHETGTAYEEELRGIFQGALERALERRRELTLAERDPRPGPRALRRGWIAYPEYWTN